MRFCILTGSEVGGAAAALETLANVDNAELACVILATGQPPKTQRYYKRRLKKIWKIGILGAINGLKLRNWFQHSVERNLRHETERMEVPLYEVPYINHDQTIKILRDAGADLGVSLGNGFIRPEVFSTPPEGMINYHGELLPEYPGAQSIIWPIYFGRSETGFTIHRISKKIDCGNILFCKKFQIKFCKELKDTVSETGKIIHPHMPIAVAHVIANFSALRDSACPNVVQRTFTTPTFKQFLVMKRRNAVLYRKQAAKSASSPKRAGN